MNYKLLGKSGLRVSELALGTMTFGQDWGWGASKEESQRIFEAYAEAGGNFIDTSNNYTEGSSEKFIGEFIQADRDHFVVATKYTLTERKQDPNFGGNHRKNLMRSLRGSLERLQTDYIDVLYLHMWDFTTPVEEVLLAMRDLIASGQVHHFAFSDTPAWVVSNAIAKAEAYGWPRPVALQVPYSLMDRAVERAELPMAQTYGLSALVWGTLEGGVLTGKYNQPSDEPKRYGEASEKEQQIAEVVVGLARELGRSPAQVALGWVRQHSPHIIPIVGARKEAHMRDNLGCLGFTLSDEQRKQLTDASPLQMGFPYSFLASDHVRGLIFGETYAQIVSR